ncbi:4a-hydroxytetrahydrobiopterin dehydratase [Candidatus Woesebacteria bacterium]|nr:4a-hydroxytetrahydrobiopterin dehydratase [Candidatus Woesebacteria bacterium]
MDLKSLKCVACRGGEPTLKGGELAKYKDSVDPSWKLYARDTKIKREFEFKNFKEALEFVNKVGELAEAEGHHPNIYLHSYKKVGVELWTHKIGGLHQNDFILASKIDLL